MKKKKETTQKLRKIAVNSVFPNQVYWFYNFESIFPHLFTYDNTDSLQNIRVEIQGE